jgi:sterol desaturase/sphingolipid hydroxylase (fatty acid hydroxylase superfamily)
MEPGMIVIIVIVVLFYVRLYLLRRGRKRRESQTVLNQMKQGKKAAPLPPRETSYRVTSWWILTPGVLLMLLGLAMFTRAILLDYQSYWWIPVGIGGVLFIFSFE